jgi:membrane associated rhomboid family serine protease
MPNFTPVVKYIILLNLVIFGLQQFALVDIISNLGLFYFGLSEFRLYQIFTNFFVHANIPHIAFNMISLYSIGMMLERVWGSKRFLNFYLICGIGASLFHLFVLGTQVYFKIGQFMIPLDQLDAVIDSIGGVAVGASGAIFGLFTAIAMLFPNTEFYLMFIPVPIKAKYLWIGLVLIDVVFGITNFSGDDIGHFAHLGGVLTGILLVKFYAKNRSSFY